MRNRETIQHVRPTRMRRLKSFEDYLKTSQNKAYKFVLVLYDVTY